MRRKVSLYVKWHLRCVELLYGLDNRLGMCLWVRIRGEVSEGGNMVGLCYRLVNLNEKLGNTSHK